jgi:hypothetical protein
MRADSLRDKSSASAGASPSLTPPMHLTMKTMRSLCLAFVFLGVVTMAHAFLRRAYSDAEVASRADLVVVGKIKPESIVLVPHDPGVAGASWEHHVELLVSEVLKGNLSSNSILVSIHYGLEPLVGGYTSTNGG